MKKNSKNSYLNIFIIIISAIIVVLLCYSIIKNRLNFEIKEEKIALKLGETRKIDYEISDQDLNIDWVSSNEDIIVKDGVITANNFGSSVITGTVRKNDKTISSTCLVTVYSGIEGTQLEKMEYENGYIVMKPNSELDIPVSSVPTNAYINTMTYSVDNYDVAIVKGSKLLSKNPGTARLSMVVNNSYTSYINIIVSEENIDNYAIKEIESVSFKDNNLNIKVGDTTKLSYYLNPENGIIEISVWESSNEKVVTVNDGEIKGISKGNATIKVIINNKVEGSVNVTVNNSNADIVIDNNPKTLIRIGEKTTIKAHLEPSTSELITYTSSNPSVASISDGTITGVGAGSTNITMSIANGKTKSFTINVLPQNGHIDGSANLWGYKSLNAKVPVYADGSFYQTLAQSGIGVLQGDTYVINYENLTYTYNITSNILSVGSEKILLRLYYPHGEDLSTLNTLVYMGGRGETNFGGVFTDITKDSSMIKSAGIIGLLAEGKSFNGDSGAYSTKFIKAITKQKAGVKNSILGFSDGAHQVLHAAKKENYNTIVIFSGYTDGASSEENAKDKEIIFMIAGNDGNYSQAKTAMSNMKSSGYRSVTMVTTVNDVSRFEDVFLTVNVNNLMKKGHYSSNVFDSGIIEYLND